MCTKDRLSRKRQIARYARRYSKLTLEEQRLHSSLLLAWFVRALLAEAARRRDKRFE